MLATVRTATLLGVYGYEVTVEVHVAQGLPSFTIVGLPDASCREARDRVRAALLSSGWAWPLQRVTVNLAPSNLRKVGAGLDLAIAVGILVALGELPAEAVADTGYIGELGLDGTVRPIPGILPLVDALSAATVVVAPAAAHQAAVLGRHQVRVAPNLRAMAESLLGRVPWPEHPPAEAGMEEESVGDLADVRGQSVARLAVEVAAAGNHHLLLVGPPGAGKTMLAQRLVGLLPELAPAAALEATRVHSAAGQSLPASVLLRRPPFRAPHHGASTVALVGGGSSVMRPGEISLAHGGILFLDELGEFSAAALDSLRQPLEEGVIRISRAHATATFPARFLLVGATNPCPCGKGGPEGQCRCGAGARLRYARRLSGPLLDRFDLRVTVRRPTVSDLLSCRKGESTATVAGRVHRARARALARQGCVNALLPAGRLALHAVPEPGARRLLSRALEGGRLSARGYHRLLRVALTLADLWESEGRLAEATVATALQLRAEVDLVGLEAA